MPESSPLSLNAVFSELPDPRSRQRREHRLVDILLLSLCATIASANGPVQIERFGRLRQDWLKKLGGPDSFLRGIPSHDTIGRVFSALDFEKFSACFVKWAGRLLGSERFKFIALDGKQARRSGSLSEERQPLHMVSAWASEASLCLGQVACSAKSNEITAIPKLLDLLELEGSLVTIDAMGCQRDIAEDIVNRHGNYLFGLKGNQKNLHKDAKLLFEWAEHEEVKEHQVQFFEHRTVDGDHGRIETRDYKSIARGDFETMDSVQRWPSLQSIICVTSKREVGDKVSLEQRYYISNIEASEIELLAKGIRAHWGVENGLHWVLDMGFREDENRCRVDHSQANLATIRRMAVNLLKQEKSEKVGIETKRNMAAWSNDYLEKVLSIMN